MFEPVEVNHIMIAVAAGALVVTFGALYALAFALGKLNNIRWLTRSAYVFFLALVVSLLALANALNLTGFWQLITAVLLVGYLLAPHAIWNLCIGTHVDPKHSIRRIDSATGDCHE